MNPTSPLLVIAGFSDGLGAALADQYINHGYHVVALSRQAPKNTIHTQHSDKLIRYSVDLTQAEQTQSVFEKVLNTYGTPDTLIHNAAQLLISPFTETPIEAFVSTWESNCLSAIMCAQCVLPKMEIKGKGSIIFTGATASIRGSNKFAAFASSKFALRGIAQSLAREYSPKGIHIVHTLIDGLIWGSQSIARFNPQEENCLMPEDIAQMYFNLSQQPSSVWTHEFDMRPAGESF